MRNPFARLARSEAPRPSLKERLTATKARAKQVLAVNAVILKGAPKPKPAPNRVALVNYSSWLHWERQRVCAELHPHMGTKATGFVLGLNAAERFFWPHGIDSLHDWPALPSTRAVKVLDLVGVDWRLDVAKGGLGGVDTPALHDTGERPTLPYGWPAPDAALTTALGDMVRISAAINALPSSLDREHNELPEYFALDEAVGVSLSTIVRTRAEGLAGLQAKAKAILSDRLEADDLGMREVAESLARDLLDATNGTLSPRRDPIVAILAEGRRLLRECDAAFTASADATDDDPRFKARNVLHGALWAYINDVLLKTVPRTADGCRDLARFAGEFHASQGVALSDDDQAVTDLIARSPLL